jgi:ABC-type phosphate/phosphonate transport system substrate-binding protein
MSVAALPMYDFEELRWATDALWAAIAVRVPGAPAVLERGRPLMDVWTDPALLLAQTCGYPLMTSLAGRVRVVATPRYRAEGCEGAFYRSAVIVRADDEAGCLADLRGRRCALNGVDSNSGMNVLRAAVAPLAGGGRFFGEVVMTGAHVASVGAVARGDADVAAIDCVTWALLGRLRPGETRGLRVLEWTAASPGLPLITSMQTNAVTCSVLERALNDVAADGSLTPALDALLIDGFEMLPIRAYDTVLKLENLAYDAGYRVLR